MVFSSLTFLLIFLPATLAVYFLVPKKMRYLRNIVLLLFSLVFYAWGEPLYIFLICVTIVITYFLSLQVSNKNKAALIASVAVNVLPLLIFKYLDFFISNINLLPFANIKETGLPLPIGISFYTFQMLTYVIDLYRGQVNHQKNILYLALYLFLFPQLIAGPIVRYSTIENELDHRNESLDLINSGLRRFIAGLAKKVLVANQVGFIAGKIMSENQADISSGLLWTAVVAYTLQIYFDFSGYSDMAIGIGKILGFNFMENFNYPYIAKSITDFWRRWHISLSTFFRDYIYIPLGGNRVKTLRWMFNMLVVWFLTGMWHGPFWNYIIWGLYYCVLLVLEKLFLNKLFSKIPSFFGHIYTLFFVMIGWLIFMYETNSPSQLFSLIIKLFNFSDGTINIQSLELYAYLPFIILGAVCSIPFIKIFEKFIKKKKENTVFAIIANTVSIVIFGGCLLFLVADSFNPFIYFRF